MHDQAHSLRNKMKQIQSNHAQVVGVVSGKGGVGKSSIALNGAMVLKEHGKRVLLIDCDLGMANLHIMLGVQTINKMSDFLLNGKSILQAITHVDATFSLLAGGFLNLDESDAIVNELPLLVGDLQVLMREYDYIILDFGAGFTKWHQFLLSICHQIIVVMIPEPTSLTDAYATIKLLSTFVHNTQSLRVVVNQCEHEKEAEKMYQHLQQVVTQFLPIKIVFLGSVRRDVTVSTAIRKRSPFYILNRSCHASKDVEKLIRVLATIELHDAKESWIMRVKKYLKESRL